MAIKILWRHFANKSKKEIFDAKIPASHLIQSVGECLDELSKKLSDDKRTFYQESFACYEKGAEVNYPPSVLHLAHAYRDEKGTEKNLDKAIQHYKKGYFLCCNSSYFSNKTKDAYQGLKTLLKNLNEVKDVKAAPAASLEKDLKSAPLTALTKTDVKDVKQTVLPNSTRFAACMALGIMNAQSEKSYSHKLKYFKNAKLCRDEKSEVSNQFFSLLDKLPQNEKEFPKENIFKLIADLQTLALQNQNQEIADAAIALLMAMKSLPLLSTEKLVLNIALSHLHEVTSGVFKDAGHAQQALNAANNCIYYNERKDIFFGAVDQFKHQNFLKARTQYNQYMRVTPFYHCLAAAKTLQAMADEKNAESFKDDKDLNALAYKKSATENIFSAIELYHKEIIGVEFSNSNVGYAYRIRALYVSIPENDLPANILFIKKETEKFIHHYELSNELNTSFEKANKLLEEKEQNTKAILDHFHTVLKNALALYENKFFTKDHTAQLIKVCFLEIKKIENSNSSPDFKQTIEECRLLRSFFAPGETENLSTLNHLVNHWDQKKSADCVKATKKLAEYHASGLMPNAGRALLNHARLVLSSTDEKEKKSSMDYLLEEAKKTPIITPIGGLFTALKAQKESIYSNVAIYYLALIAAVKENKVSLENINPTLFIMFGLSNHTENSIDTNIKKSIYTSLTSSDFFKERKEEAWIKEAEQEFKLFSDTTLFQKIDEHYQAIKKTFNRYAPQTTLSQSSSSSTATNAATATHKTASPT